MVKIVALQSTIIALAFIAIPCWYLPQRLQNPGACWNRVVEPCQEQAKTSSGYDPANPKANVQESGAPSAATRSRFGGLPGELLKDDGRRHGRGNGWGCRIAVAQALVAVAGGARSRRQAKAAAMVILLGQVGLAPLLPLPVGDCGHHRQPHDTYAVTGDAVILPVHHLLLRCRRRSLLRSSPGSSFQTGSALRRRTRLLHIGLWICWIIPA